MRTTTLLFTIINLLNDHDNINQAMRLVVKEIADQLEFSRVSITILDCKTGDIIIKQAYGLTEKEQLRGRYQLGEGITGRVVECGESIIVPHLDADPNYLNRTKSMGNSEIRDRSFICVPVRWRNKTVGSLSADRPFTDIESLHLDEKVLSIVAMMISQAVRLFQATHEENRQLVDENKRLTAELKRRFRPGNIIGQSKRMIEIFALIEKIAKTQTTVLVLGESGVGKELVAHAIHYNSPRQNGPFIRVNCSALPESMIESELFGHEQGAFTGAINDRKGRFELAHKGTIFLDEIGEFSSDMQVKLLRILQERELERVGGTRSIKIDIRVIVATNCDLEKAVEEGRFREDLYYRLNVFPMRVPPLRERKTDIPALIDYFISKNNEALGKSITRVSTPAIEMLCSYHWPGNVRELENCMERAMILAEDDAILGRHLPPTLQTVATQDTKEGGSLENRLDALEYEIIMEELKLHRGNMTKTAEALGITHRMMGLRVKKYDIILSNYKSPHIVKSTETSTSA